MESSETRTHGAQRLTHSHTQLYLSAVMIQPMVTRSVSLPIRQRIAWSGSPATVSDVVILYALLTRVG